MTATGGPLLLIVSPDGEILSRADDGTSPATQVGRVAGWTGMAELLRRASGGYAIAEVEVPGTGPVLLRATTLSCREGGSCLLVTADSGDTALAELERARGLVEHAEEVIAERDAEVEVLIQLSERLLEHAPVAAVLDHRTHIRGWSSRAARVWALSAEQVVGKPATAVIEGLDHRSLHELQKVGSSSGDVSVVVEPVGDDGNSLLVRFS
jgi:PAS domain-containing protein